MAYRRTTVALFGPLLAACVAFAGEPDQRTTDLLKRAIAKVIENDRHIQNYTCVETVRRDYFRPAWSTLPRACSFVLENRQHPTPDMRLQHVLTDRLRLDVTTAERGEIFSWVGASRFDEAGLEHLVQDGPVGTGAFGAFLGVIFEKDVKAWGVIGPRTMEGRKLIEYSFQVPQSESHYRVRMTDGEWLPAAYSGVVLVDAATAEPVGLAVQTDELPPATGSCQTFATLNYSRVRIGGNDLLLPSKAVQRFISRDGQETENTTTFSSCREYSSESSVNFYTGPEDAVKDSRTAVAPQRIPAGLRFRMQLTADIDMETAAAGDPFAAKITSTVRDRKGHVQLPKGALIAGHICLLQLRYRPEREAVLGLAPETLDIGAASVPIAALLDSRAFAGQRAHDKNRGVEIMLPPPGQYAGIFRFSGEHIIFRRGFTSEWVTALPRNAR